MYPQSSKANQQFTPPRVNGVAGNVAAITVSAVANFLDLRSLSKAQGPNVVTADGAQQRGAAGGFVSILADGADLYVVVGPTQAAVTGANAPVAATVGTVSGVGVYGDVAGTAWKIPSGQQVRFCVQDQRDFFLGFVASAVGTMRIFQSSPPVP